MDNIYETVVVQPLCSGHAQAHIVTSINALYNNSNNAQMINVMSTADNLKSGTS